MTGKKIIAVLGATGAQGGSLSRAILNDKNSEFTVRAVTRDPNSNKAHELAGMGAEVVRGDVDDIDSIKRALDGAYGAYFLTFFWHHLSAEKESQDAGRMAEAAKAAGIQHAIWSTLEDTRKWVPLEDNRMPTLHGKYKVPHFDGKGEGDKFFADLGVPTTYFLISFYWDNFIHFGLGPKKGPDGNLYITFPMDGKKMAGIGVEDVGKCAYGIFKRGKELIGKRIGIAGQHLTGDEMASAFSKALGKEVRFNNVSPDAYRAFGFPGADELGNMFQIYRDFALECNTLRDIRFSRELNPELQTFDMWLSQNAKLIPLE
jgi:uncharacterized protein YbjT (DUF2867 family)